MADLVRHYADRYPNAAIRITGYTDQVFNDQTQLKLSQSYAEVIASYIWSTGIDRKRLIVQGRGSSDRIASEIEPTSNALNRRVVVQIN